MLIMIKHKKIPIFYNNITTIFGYSLFALTVLSFLVSTAIPFGFALFTPTARHFNIAVMIVVFAVAVILPALASYFIGDRVTHAKNKALHHYNGILFGIAAYWVAQLFSWVGFSSLLHITEDSFPLNLAVTNSMPVIITIIVMALIAVSYIKKQTGRASVLQYRPYQVTLIAAIIGSFIAPYFSGSFDMNYLAASIATLVVPVILVAIAYKALDRLQPARLARLSDAIVALSFGWITIWIAATFISFTRLPYQVTSIVCYALGVVVFIAFLYLRVRKFRNTKA